jgi:hypothetical protein
MPVEVEAEPESEPEAESEPEPAPEPEPTPQPVIEKEPAPVVEHQPPAKAQPPSFSPTPQFKRRPAKPGMLIEPDVEFDHQVKEEEYDYYAWEERQSNILHRGVKIGFFILIGVSALVFAGTQAVYIWMQFTGNSKHAPTPAIVEKIPAKQVESLADPVVDPLDNIPDSSQDNITNVLDAMNKQVDKLDKESKE